MYMVPETSKATPVGTWRPFSPVTRSRVITVNMIPIVDAGGRGGEKRTAGGGGARKVYRLNVPGPPA